jgi:hypothetical protein
MKNLVRRISLVGLAMCAVGGCGPAHPTHWLLVSKTAEDGFEFSYLPCDSGDLKEIEVLHEDEVVWQVVFDPPTSQRDFEYGVLPPGGDQLIFDGVIPRNGVVTFIVRFAYDDGTGSDQVAFKYRELQVGEYAIGDIIKDIGSTVRTNCDSTS